MITIERAIELIQNNLTIGICEEGCELEKALKLGIEALYRCQEFRKYTTPKVYMPLPGETKE